MPSYYDQQLEKNCKMENESGELRRYAWNVVTNRKYMCLLDGRKIHLEMLIHWRQYVYGIKHRLVNGTENVVATTRTETSNCSSIICMHILQ